MSCVLKSASFSRGLCALSGKGWQASSFFVIKPQCAFALCLGGKSCPGRNDGPHRHTGLIEAVALSARADKMTLLVKTKHKEAPKKKKRLQLTINAALYQTKSLLEKPFSGVDHRIYTFSFV